MEILKAESITKEYVRGNIICRVLNDISFTVFENEFLAIMGASGCGKTTLLKILGGLENPTTGNVEICDVNISVLSDDERTEYRRGNIGFIFQNYNLLPFFNGYENIVLPAKLDGMMIEDDFINMIANDLGIEKQLFQKASTMSGGQQQRVAIARGIYSRPKILLADELTGNLDSATKEQVMELLKKMQLKYKQTIIMVTHDFHVAQKADRILYMKDGKLCDA